MNEQAQTVKESPLPVTNYVPVITECSWWQSKTGDRRFLITRIHYDWINEVPRPSTILVLELFKTDPIETTWEKFIRNIETGSMVKIVTNQS